MVDIEVAGRRATAQRTLRNRQGQAVHHPNERNDPAGLAVEADRLADPAHIAPIGADAAAAAGQPDVFVPGVDDALKAVVDRIEVAADRQAAPGATVRQHRRCGHEPQLADVIVDPLGVILIVRIGVGDAGEEVLIGLARQQVAIIERVLAEQGQQGIARRIGHDRETPGVHRLGIVLTRALDRGRGHGGPDHQVGRTLVAVFALLRHRHRRAFAVVSPVRRCRRPLGRHVRACHRSRIVPAAEFHRQSPLKP